MEWREFETEFGRANSSEYIHVHTPSHKYLCVCRKFCMCITCELWYKLYTTFSTFLFGSISWNVYIQTSGHEVRRHTYTQTRFWIGNVSSCWWSLQPHLSWSKTPSSFVLEISRIKPLNVSFKLQTYTLFYLSRLYIIYTLYLIRYKYIRVFVFLFFCFFDSLLLLELSLLLLFYNSWRHHVSLYVTGEKV